MGRGKSNMELIKNEKMRNTAFQNRISTVKKKAYELATLCDIKVVVIIYGPKQDTPQAHPLEPEIWPQNRDEILQLFDKYKGQSTEDRKNRTDLVPDFFKKRNKKAQQDLTTLRNTNIKSKYPTTLDSRFSSKKEDDLRKIVVFLENNIGNAKAKVEQKKANNIYRDMMSSKKRKMDFDVGNQADKYLKIHSHQAISDPMRVPIPMLCPIQQQRIPSTDYNRNQIMVKFGNEYGGPSNIVHNAPLSNVVYNYPTGGASNIVHNAPLSNVVYNYPTIGRTYDSISYVNNLARAHPNYYGEGRQSIAPQLMGYLPMTQESTSHQMSAASHQYFEDRKWQR